MTKAIYLWSTTRYVELLGIMPKSVIELSEHATRVVNVVKAKEGLRGKSEAIERIVEEYEEHVLDPSLRPDFVDELQRIRRGTFRKIRKPGDLPRDDA